jgi:hypothetical protein
MSCLEIFTIRLVVEVTLEPTEGVPLQVSGLRIKW